MKYFDVPLITRVAIRAIRGTQISIAKSVRRNPASAFRPLRTGRDNKPLLKVDVVAEETATEFLLDGLGEDQLCCVGEEELKNEAMTFASESRLVVLMDMVDGTDLLERGLSNWCSAMVFFYPPERRILAAFVGIHEDAVYYATELTHTQKHLIHQAEDGPREIAVSGPTSVTSLAEASISFYGQKVKNFLSVASHRNFCRHLDRLRRNAEKHHLDLGTRLYNLAGNPMMVRVIDGPTRMSAVFDCYGQLPHDVVPGAYLAERSERPAILSDLDGRPIDLAASLLAPAAKASRLRYVLACTQELASELVSSLSAGERPPRKKGLVASASAVPA